MQDGISAQNLSQVNLGRVMVRSKQDRFSLPPRLDHTRSAPETCPAGSLPQVFPKEVLLLKVNCAVSFHLQALPSICYFPR